MRWPLTLAILAAGLALSVIVWMLSGGRFGFLFLPLIFGLPFVLRRRP
jgi:hypothetical protein